MKESTLTRRQRQVLRLATYPNRRIAAILGIGTSTVARTFTDIYKSLDLDHISPAKGCRRIVAVTEALRRGIVTLDEIAEGDRPVRGVEETRQIIYDRKGDTIDVKEQMGQLVPPESQQPNAL